MSTLRFILGRAGTGKTHYCLEQIRARLRENPQGTPLILLAPEQATFQLEQALATTPGLGGFFRAHVLSFRRLAYRIFDELGGRGIPPAGNLKRLLILKTILARRQSDLQYFGPSARTVGFARALDSTLAEWRRYGFCEESARACIERWGGEPGPHSYLARKLHDLALVEQDYRASISQRFLDPEDFLERFVALAGRSQLLAGAEVWIDGFADFTGLERQALLALIQAVRSAEMALCLDPATLHESAPERHNPTDRTDRTDRANDFVRLVPSRPRPFGACERTYWRVRRLAQEQAIQLLPDLPLEKARRFDHAPELALVEKHFFTRTLLRVSPALPSALRLVRAQSIQAEVEFVALEALHLAREERIPYREMAVVTRDLETCHDLLRAALNRLGIPFFMDRQREIVHHPLAQLLAAAAEIVALGWRRENVMQALKTNLLPLAADEADRLENYALRFGLDGEDWLEEGKWNDELRITNYGESSISSRELFHPLPSPRAPSLKFAA